LPVLAGFVLREAQASIKEGSTSVWTKPTVTAVKLLSPTIDDFGTVYEVKNFINAQQLVSNVVDNLKASGKL
jgi:hypothetical protein